MSARSGLVGKRTSRPHLDPSQAIFCMGQKIEKKSGICLFSLVGQWALFTRFGVWGLDFSELSARFFKDVANTSVLRQEV